MAKYNVYIEERLRKVYSIEAQNEEEAIDIVEDEYHNCNDDYVLTCEDFIGVDFGIEK